MDVFCCGMYRACSTWQYEVIAHLIERHQGGQRLGYVVGEHYVRPLGGEGGTSRRPWRVLKSHEGDRAFACSLSEGRAYAVYAYRDVRDVVYSLMHKRRTPFDQLVRQGMVHQIFVNHRFWTRQPRVLSQRYEEITADPALAVAQIANHLGLDIERNEAIQVASEYSMRSNRQRMTKLSDSLAKAGVDLSDPENAQLWDGETLLHWNHLRAGKAGDWRDRATSLERRAFRRLCDDWLIEHGYEPTPDDDQAPSLDWSARLVQEFAIQKGWLSCRARTASLRYPTLSRRIKAVLRMRSEGAVRKHFTRRDVDEPRPIHRVPQAIRSAGSFEG